MRQTLSTVREMISVIALMAAVLMVKSGDVSAADTPQKTLRILTSFYPMYIATVNVANGVTGVEVRNLTLPQTGCLHDYQLTTEDMINVSKADVFVVNGAGMESFLDKVLKQSPKTRIIQASEGIKLLKSDGAEEGNPHVWVSVSLHIKQVASIADQLAKLDPSHAAQYRQNAADYTAKLEALRTKMHDELKDIKRKDIVTFHEAFPYFAKEFNLNILAVIEREPGSEPSAKELAELIDIVKAKKAKVLFVEPQYPGNEADIIARETAAKVYTLDPVVTGPDAPDAYLKIMEANLETLKKALNR